MGTHFFFLQSAVVSRPRNALLEKGSVSCLDGDERRTEQLLRAPCRSSPPRQETGTHCECLCRQRYHCRFTTSSTTPNIYIHSGKTAVVKRWFPISLDLSSRPHGRGLSQSQAYRPLKVSYTGSTEEPELIGLGILRPGHQQHDEPARTVTNISSKTVKQGFSRMVLKFRKTVIFFSTLAPPCFTPCPGRACESRSSCYSSSTSLIFGFTFGESPPEAQTLLGYLFGSPADVELYLKTKTKCH